MMATMAWYTAIALWCSNPTAYNPVMGQERSPKEVQACRERMIKCLEEENAKRTYDGKDLDKCFKQEKLK